MIEVENTSSGEALERLRVKLSKYKGQFGRGRKFYQSLEGIVEDSLAQRPTKKRLEAYQFLDLIDKKTRALDIGSNCGFISLTIGKLAGEVTGVEASSELVEISNEAKEIVGGDNCKFINCKFGDFKTDHNFDIILSLAVHGWVEIPFRDYVDKIANMLNVGGHLVFESHDITKCQWDKNIKNKEEVLLEYFDIVHRNTVKDDLIIPRYCYLLKKKIS